MGEQEASTDSGLRAYGLAAEKGVSEAVTIGIVARTCQWKNASPGWKKMAGATEIRSGWNGSTGHHDRRKNFFRQPRRKIAEAFRADLMPHIVFPVRERHAQLAQPFDGVTGAPDLDHRIF